MSQDEEIVVAMLAACEATVRHLWDIAGRFNSEQCNAIRDEIHRLNKITLPAIKDLEPRLASKKSSPLAEPPTLGKLREMAEPSVAAMMTLFKQSSSLAGEKSYWQRELREMLVSYGEMLFQQCPLASPKASPLQAETGGDFFERIIKMARCQHEKRGGGNDYMLCDDCGLMWDCRRESAHDGLVNFIKLQPLGASRPSPADKEKK